MGIAFIGGDGYGSGSIFSNSELIFKEIQFQLAAYDTLPLQTNYPNLEQKNRSVLSLIELCEWDYFFRVPIKSIQLI
jgi:hypothetical protein